MNKEIELLSLTRSEEKALVNQCELMFGELYFYEGYFSDLIAEQKITTLEQLYSSINILNPEMIKFNKELKLAQNNKNIRIIKNIVLISFISSILLGLILSVSFL